MATTKHSYSSVERVPSKAVKNNQNSFPLFSNSHFSPSNSPPGYKLGANRYREITYATSNPVMCHMNSINIQLKPVGCQKDFSI